jgi:hypothetical protein
MFLRVTIFDELKVCICGGRGSIRDVSVGELSFHAL